MTSGQRIWALALAGTTAFGLAAGIKMGHPSVQADSPAATQTPEQVNLVIVPDALGGSDKKTHDAYIPTVMTATAGRKVIVTIYNLDTAPHSFTSPALGVNQIVPGAKAQGLKGVATFSFTASKPGTYHWKCILPCDNGGVNAWAMTHDGYMAGTITVVHA
jgi:heme/copper-type cytochrome/quinol oxidase subunit 2